MRFRSLFRRSNIPVATCSAHEAGPDNAETNKMSDPVEPASPSLNDQVAAVHSRVKVGDISIPDIEAAVSNLLPTGLVPEELYALVAFVRHERRQLWVGHLVESRLRGQGAELASMGAFAHPKDVPRRGDVPDEPGWQYYFHGRGCCFTHADGTSIDVDFADDGTAIDIDAFFFTNFLKSLPSAEWCERQLKRDEGFDGAWKFDLVRLAELNLIRRELRFRLTDAGRRTGEILEPLIELLDDLSPRVRCWLLCSLGDFQNAAAQLETHEIPACLTEAIKIQRQQRVAMLLKAINGSDESHARYAIAAFGVLGSDHALPVMRSALQKQPSSGGNHTAFEVLKTWKTSAVTDCLVETFEAMTAMPLLDRIKAHFSSTPSMESERPRLGLLVKIAEELMRRYEPKNLPAELRQRLVASLGADCYAMDDDAGFLLYLLEPELGLQKLSRSLTHQVPITRTGAACFLALIGDARCVEILIEASKLPESGGHEAACVLSLMPDAAAQSAATNWARRNDGYEDATGQETEVNGRVIRTWTMDEVMRSNLRGHLQYSYERTKHRCSSLLSRWTR